MPGVKAVITAKDLPETTATIALGEAAIDLHDIGDNLLARTKVLYHGHAVAAVAATTLDIAREAAAVIQIVYEVLEPVTGIDRAIAADADPAPVAQDEGRAVRGRRRTDQYRVAPPVQARRRRRGIPGSGRRRRARVPDADGPSGLYRATRLHRAMRRRRTRGRVVHDAGTVRRARRLCGDRRPRSGARESHPERRLAAASAAKSLSTSTDGGRALP